MSYSPRIITPGKMIITPNNKIARCTGVPPYEFDYGLGNCCCFVDPSHPAWNSETIYGHLSCVSHDDDKWYSTIVGDNQGNEPGVDEGWITYQHGWGIDFYECDNEDWDSFPPFGGINKSPAKYALSAKIESRLYVSQYGETYDYKTSGNVLIHIPTYDDNCQFRGWAVDHAAKEGTNIPHYDYSWDIPPSCLDGSCSGDSVWKTIHGVGLQFYVNIRTGIIGYRGIWAYTKNGGPGCEVWCQNYLSGDTQSHNIDWHTANIGECAIKGTITIGRTYDNITDDVVISWRPLDCDYEPWDSTKDYSLDDCVAWNGKFYRSCANSNQGNEPEDDASNVCEPGYKWRTA